MKKNFLKVSLLLASTAVIFTSCVKEPTSSFTASKSTAQVGEPIVFTNSSESVKNSTYSYDFGDGTQSTGINGLGSEGVLSPSHTYDKAGTYTVSQFIKASNDIQKGKGKVATSTVTVTITAPVAEFTASKTACSVGEAITLTNATTGDDGLGAPVNYYWQSTGISYSISSNKNTVFTAPSTPGIYTIVLTATQGKSSTTKSLDITVGVSNTLSSTKLDGLLEGEWNVAVTSTFTTPGPSQMSGNLSTVVNYKKVTFNDAGSAILGLDVKTSSGSFSTTGNLVPLSGTVFINYLNATTVDLGGLVNVSNSFNSPSFPNATYSIGSYNLDQDGVYKIVGTPTATSITLTKTVQDIVTITTNSGSPNYTSSSSTNNWEATYTITLTK